MLKFKKMVTSWVDIGDGLDNLMTYVVDDVRSAVHAISSFFHALGADIKDGIDWLKHHVLELLAEAEANAKIIQGWFSSAIGTAATPGPFMTMADGLSVDTDNFFPIWPRTPTTPSPTSRPRSRTWLRYPRRPPTPGATTPI